MLQEALCEILLHPGTRAAAEPFDGVTAPPGWEEVPSRGAFTRPWTGPISRAFERSQLPPSNPLHLTSLGSQICSSYIVNGPCRSLLQHGALHLLLSCCCRTSTVISSALIFCTPILRHVRLGSTSSSGCLPMLKTRAVIQFYKGAAGDARPPRVRVSPSDVPRGSCSYRWGAL